VEAVIGQLADAIGDIACLIFLFGGICEIANCPVHELAVHELAYPRVVQLPCRQFSGWQIRSENLFSIRSVPISPPRECSRDTARGNPRRMSHGTASYTTSRGL